MKESNLDKIVEEINFILDARVVDSKSLSLARQRGYLTGWLARLATTDRDLRQEIRKRFQDSKKT